MNIIKKNLIDESEYWNNFLYDVIPTNKKGSKIKIKKQNKGKFTDYCGGKVTQECINRGKNSSSATIRKRATFADNARHFKHHDGGKMAPKKKKNFIKYWYSNRKPQINKNIKEARSSTAQWNKQMSNIDKYKWYRHSRLLPKNVKAVLGKNDFNDGYVNGMTLPDYKIIYFNNFLPGSSIQIHEGTHSQEPTIQQTIIPKHIRLKPGVYKSDYLDDPDEINSRVMEFRYANKLDPSRKYTIQEIRKMKDFGDGGLSWPGRKRPLDLLERYDDKTLLWLINDLALNDVNDHQPYEFLA